MKPITTLRDIATALNLSVSTVSRALKYNPDISAQTIEKVHELAKMLDYEPNNYAVQLRTKTSKLLGLIIPSVSNYFYNSFIEAVEKDCNKNGYLLLVLQSNEDDESLLQNLNTCRQNKIGGIFICSNFLNDPDEFFKLKTQGIPIIFFDKVPDTNQFHKVCLEDEKAAIIAAQTILSKNKKNILALFGNISLSITAKRLNAFVDVIQQNSHTNLYVETNVDATNAKESVEEYFSDGKKIDCIFCMSDEILTGVMHTVQRLGLKYPSDIGVIALSNGFFPSLYFPEITYVETSGNELGKLAFSQMINIIKGNEVAGETFVKSVLIDKGSL